MYTDQSQEETQALLPLFRPSPLDSIPIYNIVLEIRDLFVERIETPLKYDQLRSPQVHSFLIKPLVSACKTDLNPGTIYALLANMIQFAKESTSNVAMTGILGTRSMICEIVAIKLLKEYNEDDLISALTFDFYPLQTEEVEEQNIPRWQRIFTLELAVKGEAKRFLANPSVTQVLEQIWNGDIMFQKSLHKLHRIKFSNQEEAWRLGLGRPGPKLMYNYEDASIFKLSRLRVPRYRHLLNLGSFCGLLCIYMLVLAKNTPHISMSEVVFTLWSLSFIIDEIAAFTDVGFTLYFLSLWNLFDLVILVLLTSYAVLRYWAYMSGDSRIQQIAHDLLATVAIFLFPRLFSILDNYESFSRMVVSVRKMTIDLSVAWLVIVVFSSGFWVAFAMAFAREDSSSNPSKVAYDLMKILFGFTPTVWDSWNKYSVLGRCILLFYLFITHFVIMTILIAVLSNSFAMITENSHEEHRYLFAVNTISIMKSESSSLFSYVPPLNLIEWIVRPTTYFLPMHQFLILNRTIIKITHFPVLFVIFVYERLYLSIKHVKQNKNHESEHAIRQLLRNKQQQRQQNHQSSNVLSTVSVPSTPNRKIRRRKAVESGGQQVKKRQHAKNKISNYDLLDEVFKRPYKGTVKPKPPQDSFNYDSLGRSSTGTRHQPRQLVSNNHIYRTFSSEINSDPEEFRTRRFSDTYQTSTFEDDEPEFPAGIMSTAASRKTKRNSSFGPADQSSLLDHRLSSDLQHSKSRKKNVSDDLYWGNSREQRIGRSRKRLYSTVSSMFRDNDQTMALSPTRSASSFMAKARNIRSQIKAWDLIHERNEGAITDEDGDEADDEEEEDEDADDVDSVTKVILDRLDALDTMFRRMENTLEKVAERKS